MPEKPSKTQPEKTDQTSAKVERTTTDSKTSNPKPQKTSEKKTKSRLPNKSLTNAEVAKKQTEPTKKSESKSSKTSVKVITEKSEKPAKKATQKTSKSDTETITVKTKPKAKSSKAPATSTTVKVKVQPANAKKPKPATKPVAKKPEIKQAEITKPEVKKSESPKPKVAKVAKTAKAEAKKPNPKKFSFLTIFSQVIAVILGFSSLFFIGMLIHLDVLPTHYLLLAIFLIILITAGFDLLLIHKKAGVIIKVPVIILSIVFSCVYLVGGGYIAETSGFLDSLKPAAYISEQYYLIVRNDSDFQDVKSLQDKTVGTFDEDIELYQEAIKQLNNTISVNLESVKSVHAMTEGLLSSEFDAVFLSAVHKSVIDEDSAEFSNNTRILYTIEAKVKADAVEEPKVNVTSESFTVYISGNDSYGDLAARGLSDVNMLATVNPVTHEVLLTSIPRDCFVQLHGTTGGKDKLTHAGLYGVQMSILTIEDLLDINIDYYVKINFPALVNIVDAIGGIDVYSDKTFKPLHGDKIVNEGMNHFDGAMALAFARERMAYTYGDRHRVQNQRDVLNAIIQKVSSSSVILTKTNEILNSISSNLDTNISKSEISSLVKLQLSSMPSWQIAEYMVNGSDLYTYTYTFGDMPRYVLPPFPESIQAAHDYITGIMEGKTIEELNIPAPEKSWK